MVSVKNLERNLREFKLLAAKVTKGANLVLKAAKAANRRSSMSPKRRRGRSVSPRRRRSSVSPKRRRRPVSPKRKVMNNVTDPLDKDDNEEKEISMNNLEKVPMNVPLHKTNSCSYGQI